MVGGERGAAEGDHGGSERGQGAEELSGRRMQPRRLPNHVDKDGTGRHRGQHRRALERKASVREAPSDLGKKRQDLGDPRRAAEEWVFDVGCANALVSRRELQVALRRADRARPRARTVDEYPVGERHAPKANLLLDRAFVHSNRDQRSRFAPGCQALSRHDLVTHAYARAAHIASTVGDSAGVLQVDVGIANNHMARGNIPDAESLLDNVIEEARAGGFNDVLGLALHSRASVAHLRGAYADAVRIGYEALEATSNLTARDGILADIAAAFAGMGMRDAARDGYLIVAVTAQSQWVRWQATLNLMELAAMDGRGADFNAYAREMESAPLPPRLRAYYFIFRSAGEERFGQPAEAQASLAEGLEFATRNQLHQIAHEAQAAIAELESRTGSRFERMLPPADVPSNVRNVAKALSDLLREAAASSP